MERDKINNLNTEELIKIKKIVGRKLCYDFKKDSCINNLKLNPAQQTIFT